MEASGSKLDQVNVLRQTFRPNEPFRTALSSLVLARAGEARSFSIYGSDERVVDMEADRIEFNVQQREADKFMATKHNVHLGIETGIRARLLRPAGKGAVALQLVMSPANRAEYRHLSEGLDIITLGERRRALGFEAMQLYATIPFSLLVPLPDVKTRLARINQELENDLAHRMFQVTPLPYLVNTITQRPLIVPES